MHQISSSAYDVRYGIGIKQKSDIKNGLTE